MRSESTTPYSIGDIGAAFKLALSNNEGGRRTVKVYAPTLGLDGNSVDSVTIERNTVVSFVAQEKKFLVPVTAIVALVSSERDNTISVHVEGSRMRP